MVPQILLSLSNIPYFVRCAYEGRHCLARQNLLTMASKCNQHLGKADSSIVVSYLGHKKARIVTTSKHRPFWIMCEFILTYPFCLGSIEFWASIYWQSLCWNFRGVPFPTDIFTIGIAQISKLAQNAVIYKPVKTIFVVWNKWSAFLIRWVIFFLETWEADLSENWYSLLFWKNGTHLNSNSN